MKKLIAILSAVIAGDGHAQTNFADVLTELETELERKRPELAASFRPPLSSEQIANLEETYDILLPDDVKTLYRWHDGQDPGAFTTFVNNMQLQPLKKVLASKSEFDSMIGYDFELENWWHPSWLPLFHNGGGDYLVVDMAGISTGNTGQLLTFYHDEEYRPIVAKDLATFFQAVTEYHDNTPVEDMDEFHHIHDFLPESEKSFEASGPAKPLH